MTTFTASEVRDRKRFEEWYATHSFNYSRDPIGSRDCSLQWEAWKAARADLLEAREKAVPVMVVNHVSSAEHDLPIGMKLYTHPQPAQDAALYQELLMAVEKKFPGESRHETALRYIRETELQSCEPKCDAAMAKESGR